MVWGRSIAEVVRALAVLALVCLNFTHAPLAAGPADHVAPVALSGICGDAPAGDPDRAHAPCHACRTSAAALPAPPCTALAADRCVAPVAYATTPPATRRLASCRANPPRAPPAA